jgi:hypothetical protein
MPPAVFARVILIGKAKPSILTFTNRQGHEICDHPQDFDPAGDDDDDSAGELNLDVIPGVDPAPEDDDAELPGVDTDFDAKPTGVEVDSNYDPQYLNEVDGLEQQDTNAAHQRNQALSQPLCQLMTLHRLAKERQHAMPGQGNLLRSTSQP